MKCPKCGADLSQFEPEITYLKETGLIAYSEDQRIEYIKGVIEALAQAIEKITSQKGALNQLKMASDFLREWSQHQEELLPALIYTIKPEFRISYYQLLERLSTLNNRKIK